MDITEGAWRQHGMYHNANISLLSFLSSLSFGNDPGSGEKPRHSWPLTYYLQYQFKCNYRQSKHKPLVVWIRAENPHCTLSYLLQGSPTFWLPQTRLKFVLVSRTGSCVCVIVNVEKCTKKCWAHILSLGWCTCPIFALNSSPIREVDRRKDRPG